jgi:acylphosphatase
MISRRWLLSGRVRGVGFRYFAHRLARELGVAGRVRNLPDGRVEIVVTGPAAILERFKEGVRRGPRGASVMALEEEELLEPVEGDGFEIEH